MTDSNDERPKDENDINYTDRVDPHSHTADAVETGQPVEAQYARQGRKGGRMVMVLVVSVTLAVIVLLGYFALSSPAIDEQTSATPEPAAVATFAEDGEPSAPVQAEAQAIEEAGEPAALREQDSPAQ